MQVNELRKAVRDGDAVSVRRLLSSPDTRASSAEAGPSWQPLDGPLHEAANAEVAELLIDAGYSVDAPGWMELTPLHQAAWHGRTEVVRTLIASGADVNARHAKGLAPLSVAATPEIALLLLERGADHGYREELGTSPLHRAAMEGRPGVVKVLCEAGADVDQRNIWDQTPLHHAVNARDLPATVLLQEAGANVNAVDDAGNTALHLAAARGCVDIVRVLVEGGADVTLCNDRGHSPSEIVGWSEPQEGELETWEGVAVPRAPRDTPGGSAEDHVLLARLLQRAES